MTWTVGSEVVHRELDGETILVDPRGREYLALDEVGTVVWRALEGGASTDELVTALCAEYDVDAETARRDVLELIEELQSHGLVVSR